MERFLVEGKERTFPGLYTAGSRLEKRRLSVKEIPVDCFFGVYQRVRNAPTSKKYDGDIRLVPFLSLEGPINPGMKRDQPFFCNNS